MTQREDTRRTRIAIAATNPALRARYERERTCICNHAQSVHDGRCGIETWGCESVDGRHYSCKCTGYQYIYDEPKS